MSHHPPQQEAPMPLTPRHETRISAFIRRHAVAFIFIVIVSQTLTTAGLYLLYTGQRDTTTQQGADEAQQADISRCQGLVNRKLIATLRARSDTTRQAVLAPQPFFHALLPALLSPHSTATEQRKVLAALIAANRAANRRYARYVVSQNIHPIPPLPDCQHSGGTAP